MTDQERVAFLREQHRQVCFEQGDHPDEVDTAYSAGADALTRAALTPTPQEAAKVLLADMVRKQANYVRILRAQPHGGFTGLRLSLTAISEDSQ